MSKPVQQRTLRTRAKLLDVAETLVREAGYEALRVEEVVARAGVAKGTFFAHFRDKDALMEILIGQELDALLTQAGALPAPADIAGICARLLPVHGFMTCERYVFDLILRYSGAAAVTEIGPIAMSFDRYATLVTGWMPAGDYRRDVDDTLLAEGVQAFAVQSMGLQFCALHQAQSFQDRFETYLAAWLTPAV
ncbi:TetR/AcrR family transcriptional regulator [Sedimentitalea sp. JM2-8]|uniref:TetR/AcrR family transcriptional regulator n=1 Tax=Sedimentitalea xiamensis TaxID=3050037 RepID=A0ABT7FE23_9RHOB|nr:TetR/AcrR family transcriptional regulator [Sedimentitalea xiamensis]MDK3073373.1 TetR/AcrR family transcriptional regulator [Sedimentitalea xiamensis]